MPTAIMFFVLQSLAGTATMTIEFPTLGACLKARPLIIQHYAGHARVVCFEKATRA